MNTTLPTVTPHPIQRAAFMVGTLPQSSGASPAGEIFAEVAIDVPDGRLFAKDEVLIWTQNEIFKAVAYASHLYAKS